MAKVDSLFKKVFGYLPEHFNPKEITFSGNDNSGLLKISYEENSEELLVTENNELLNENDEFVIYFSDLYIFPTFEEFNTCPSCNGEGYTEEFIGCSRPASDCCGGCTAKVECDCEDKPFKID